MPADPRPAARRLGWSAILPFLVLAYPVTFLLYRGGRYCGPLCFAPTPRGAAAVVASLLALALVAVGVAAGLGLRGRRADRGLLDRLLSPPPLAGVALGGLFGAFVLFLTLDALSLYEAVWKPVVLPLSFLAFLPVWALYAGTFPLAVASSVVGLAPSPGVTLAVRGVVVFLGFPLSAVWQTLVVSAVVGGRRAGDDGPDEP